VGSPAEADAGERDDRLGTAELQKLKQLRKENAELRRANEILKAASVFFDLDRPRTGPCRPVGSATNSSCR
jgi:transposase